MKLSIRSMMVIVAVLAVTVFALTDRSPILVAVYNSSVHLVLLYSVLAASLGRGASRCFWIGFAFFGWAYIAIETGWLGLDSALVANELLSLVSPWLIDKSTLDLVEPVGILGPPLEQNALSIETAKISRIGHGFGTLIQAVLGGILGKMLGHRAIEMDRLDRRESATS